MRLPIAIHKDPDSVYGVIVPDIPGCHSWGDTLDQAIEQTEEAIASHLETLLELGEKIEVKPSAIETLVSQEAYTGAYWAFAHVDMSRFDAKPERINISLPRFILQKIDQHTQLTHQTRSGFLAKAALHELANR